uniref:Uncharacterized protein n=1 Tax=Cannabis sativa TaxID=3483 RepID=A0A803NU29_CANSA
MNTGKSSADLFQGFGDFVLTSIACYYAKDAFSHGGSKLRKKKLIILAPLSEYRIKMDIDESLRWCDINKQNFIQTITNQRWYDDFQARNSMRFSLITKDEVREWEK